MKAPRGVSERRRAHRGRSLVAGALLAALLSSIGVTLVTQVWSAHVATVPFEYTHSPGDDQQDATLDLMLIKDIHETGWFNHNPALNAPFQQQWAEWPMGGDILAYTMKKAIVETTGNVPLTFNLFWLLTFPLAALAAFPALRSLRCSWSSALVGSVLFSLAPYHFRNGAAHENLAFYVGIPVIVLLCMKMLGPDAALPTVSDLRHRAGWWRLRWLLLGTILVAVTGIYYLAFLLSMLGVCAILGAIARRRPSRLVLALPFAALGLITSSLANLPTLLFRWNHAHNRLGVPDRVVGAAEAYPLRLVELLSPVTAHRFGPFAALADHLYEPGREGFGSAQLGLVAAIGFVCALITVLVRATRGSEGRGSEGRGTEGRGSGRHGWSHESRLGIVIVVALLLGMKGGISRALELTGLQGVRAWSRIAIVVAFASIAVFARLLDRVRVSMRHRQWPRSRLIYATVLVVVVVLGVLDQAAPPLMPNAGAAERSDWWHDDGEFVTSLQGQLPRGAMVFQLPVVDFPEHGAVGRMSAHDLIKEGYLHSTTLRWSAGGVRGRSGEWQFPAADLSMRDLVRGVTAMGFSAIMLDRYGFKNHSDTQVRELDSLLGGPIATKERRLAAWDLRPARASLLRGLSTRGVHTLARRMLDAPQLYMSTDIDPLTNRGDKSEICSTGTITLVNPGADTARSDLEITFRERESAATGGHVDINGRAIPISADRHVNKIPVEIAPGATDIKIVVETPDVRCKSVPSDSLPSIEVHLVPATRKSGTP